MPALLRKLPHSSVREGFKNPRHGNFPWRGGYPPFPLTFFRWVFGNRPSVEGGRGVPPLSVKKKSIKNWPKNGVFWAKNAVFGEKISVFRSGPSVEGRGGVPPFSVNFFPLTFRKILVRGGPGGGGVPPQRKVSVLGVFETFP